MLILWPEILITSAAFLILLLYHIHLVYQVRTAPMTTSIGLTNHLRRDWAQTIWVLFVGTNCSFIWAAYTAKPSLRNVLPGKPVLRRPKNWWSDSEIRSSLCSAFSMDCAQ